MASSLAMTQDVVWCDLCPTNEFLKCPAELHCKRCNTNLCQGCAGKHLLSKKSTTHEIVEYKDRTMKTKYEECRTYPSRKCKLQCNQCQVTVCAACLTDSHRKHDIEEKSTDANIADHMLSALSLKERLETPEVIAETDSKDYLCRMTYAGSDQVWITGRDKTIKRVNIHGKLLQKITDACRAVCPADLSTTRTGALLFCDSLDCSVKMIQDNIIYTVITLQDWIPRAVCISSSQDIIVFMITEENAKFARYSGSVLTQEIQHDQNGRPIFSSTFHNRFIEENKNQDICVQNDDHIVVVNQYGLLRFKYDGKHTANKHTKIRLRGIATDSKCQILVADCYNHCVHVIDKDGDFLCYIDNCELVNPSPVIVDKQDRLRVGSYDTGIIKVIKYME